MYNDIVQLIVNMTFFHISSKPFLAIIMSAKSSRELEIQLATVRVFTL